MILIHFLSERPFNFIFGFIRKLIFNLYTNIYKKLLKSNRMKIFTKKEM
jgi:hypothetical protein